MTNVATEFAVGTRVAATKNAFNGRVPFGSEGTVVASRDSGVNVKWDNGFEVRNGSATIGPYDIRKLSEPGYAVWAAAPSWAQYLGTEKSGARYWFNLPPLEYTNGEFRRGVDTRDGAQSKRHDSLPYHDGTFRVEARPVAAGAAATPQGEARYLLRIIKCPANPGISGTYVRSIYKDGALVGNGDRLGAKRLSYAEVVEFLRSRAEDDSPDRRHRKDTEVEVLLDYIKTGAKPKPEPKRGNNGWAVGTKLRCTLSGHPAILPRQTYEVIDIDADGDEVIDTDSAGGALLAKYGRSERNEYTRVHEVK